MNATAKKGGGVSKKTTGGSAPKKRGRGVKKIDGGEGAFQRELLESLKARFGLSDTKCAEMLGTNYNTYKTWKNGSRRMTGTTTRLIAVFMNMNKNKISRMFLD